MFSKLGFDCFPFLFTSPLLSLYFPFTSSSLSRYSPLLSFYFPFTVPSVAFLLLFFLYFPSMFLSLSLHFFRCFPFTSLCYPSFPFTFPLFSLCFPFTFPLLPCAFPLFSLSFAFPWLSLSFYFPYPVTFPLLSFYFAFSFLDLLFTFLSKICQQFMWCWWEMSPFLKRNPM